MKERTLEIDEDLAFQRREWFWQRIGMALMFVFILGALLGVTGMGGPLSHGEAGDRGGLIHAEYERVVRRGAPATITLHLRTQSTSDIQFWISSSYFEHVKIDAIAPQPESVSVQEGRHVYTIRGGASNVTVVLELEHSAVGRVQAEAGLIGGPSVRFSQVALF